MLNAAQLQGTDGKEHGDTPAADGCARSSVAQQAVMTREMSRAASTTPNARANGRRSTGAIKSVDARPESTTVSDARKRARSASRSSGRASTDVTTCSVLSAERGAGEQQAAKRRNYQSSTCALADLVVDVRQKEDDASVLNPNVDDQSVGLRTDTVPGDGNVNQGDGTDAFEALVSADNMVTDMPVPDVVSRLAPAPLVSFTRAALGSSNPGNWESDPSSLPRSDNFGIDDILELPGGSEMEKEAFWGDLEYPVLSQDTQYLQLLESRDQQQGQQEQQPPPGPSSVLTQEAHQGSEYPALNLTLSPNFGNVQPPSIKPTSLQMGTSSSTQSADAVNAANSKQNPAGKATAAKDTVPQNTAAPQPFLGSPWAPHIAPPRSNSDMYADVLAPEIETRILTARNPSSGSSAIRIAPRDKSKPESSRMPSSGGRENSRSRHGSRPKRSRQGSAQPVQAAPHVRPHPREHGRNQQVFPGLVSNGLPGVRPGGMQFPVNTPLSPAVAANPVAAAAAMAAAMAVGGSVGVPQPPAGSISVPHPMAGPLLFAQAFPPLNNNSSHPHFPVSGSKNTSGEGTPHGIDPSQFRGEQRPGFVPVPQTSTGADTSNRPSESNGGSSTPTPMIFPGTPYNMPQMMAPGMMPMDPNAAFMHMAQMWYAALTGAGNSPPVPPLSDPARAAFLNQAGLLNAGQTGGVVPVTPRTNGMGSGSGPSGTALHPIASGGAIPSPNTATPKTRPMFIADDGTHVVVEQQAPAKLMRHPVLGRLQLQSKNQTSDEQANGAMSSYSGRGVREDGTRRDGDGVTINTSKGRSASSPATSPTASSPKDRRKRLVWTPELHDRFVQAISAIGINQAVPKTLVQIMNVEGLTTEHVKSHLQKYRNSLRRAAVEDAQDKVVKVGQTASGTNRMFFKPNADVGDRSTREVRIMPSRANSAVSNDAKNKRSDGAVTEGAVPSDVDVRESNSGQPADRAVPGAGTSPAEKLDVEMAEALDARGLASTMVGASAVNRDSLGLSSAHPGRGLPTPSANQANTKSEDRGGAQSSSGETETRLQMQERTMQLQFQLQIMVHRAVALQKELQCAIEKQNEQTRRRGTQVGTSAPVEAQNADGPSASREEGAGNATIQSQKEGEKGGRDLDINELVNKQMQMQRELDRQTAIVRHEIDAIQQRLGESTRMDLASTQPGAPG